MWPISSWPPQDGNTFLLRLCTPVTALMMREAQWVYGVAKLNLTFKMLCCDHPVLGLLDQSWTFQMFRKAANSMCRGVNYGRGWGSTFSWALRLWAWHCGALVSVALPCLAQVPCGLILSTTSFLVPGGRKRPHLVHSQLDGCHHLHCFFPIRVTSEDLLGLKSLSNEIWYPHRKEHES